VAEEHTSAYGQDHSTRLDIAKMHLDISKHMMTFCSGGLVLVPTVTKALFPAKVEYGVLLWVSMVGFVLAVTHAMLRIYVIPREIEKSEQAAEDTIFSE
jgi:hypothetical protein